MKKTFKKKVKKMKNEILTNENKGFSLVELIVVIAIMAVMTSVLAPSLLGYVEQSRMQKDDSAMGEVTNAIKLALADQDVYDECLKYNVKGNYSCYVDDKNTAASSANARIDKQVKNEAAGSETFGTGADENYWQFEESTRLKDETPYVAAGNMRGMTLTFVPTDSGNASEFKMKNAFVNNMGVFSDATNRAAAKSKTKVNNVDVDAMLNNITSGAAGKDAMLYNKLRAVIGDSIILSSQTYRNSEYTVFIRMGSMGGNQASAQDAVAVYGQWNGTNLETPARVGA